MELCYLRSGTYMCAYTRFLEKILVPRVGPTLQGTLLLEVRHLCVCIY